ncbi:MAG: T9SS type A sorting domain-containing protein [Crocinitomicaceae bacterium]|nr:T9SS type A sorting domain-containing protein [Crocinitomicaceae bacterium]
MKTYLSIIACTVAMTSTHAQIAEFTNPAQLEEFQATTQPDKPTAQAMPKTVVWNETFDIGTSSPATTLGPTFSSTNNGTWTTGGANGNVWKHSFFKTSGEWSSGVVPMSSTTEADGKMLFDADSVNFPISPNYIALYGELISPPIDLTGNTSAVLSWEQNSRFCCGGILDLEISISSDNGVTWGPIIDADDNFAPGDDFHSHNNFSYLSSVNISGEAAGNTILLKFTWNGLASGSSHYYWELDDISISTIPDHDMQVLSSWFVGEFNDGIQYASTPENQQDDNYYVGSEVVNAGALAQNNVAFDADFNTFNSNTSVSTLSPNATIVLETLDPLSQSVGTYTGIYSVVSDDDIVGGVDFEDNIDTVQFEITAATTTTGMGSMYSLDGIGLYDNPITTEVGTNSYTGGADGLVLANKYIIKEGPAHVCALRVLLGPGTIPGGEIYGSIKDTTFFMGSDMASLYNTTVGTVTASDTTQGYIDLWFPGPVTLIPGAYFAAIELYSQGNNYVITVLDDETVEQPLDASMIYIPADQVYFNGNAFGIRLIHDWCWSGLPEGILFGVSIFPNPSEGLVTITNDNLYENTIVVFDLTGKVILTKNTVVETSIDLSTQGSGVYMVEVSNDQGMMTERIVIQ